MLTGEKPFFAEEIPALLYRIAHEPPPSAHALNPTLGWPVDVVLKRALEKGPAARYSTCAEFVAALESACRTSKDWRPLPRGASQTLPTVAAAAVSPDPAGLPAGTAGRIASRRARENPGPPQGHRRYALFGSDHHRFDQPGGHLVPWEGSS
jgi:serine/threonine protein kinase